MKFPNEICIFLIETSILDNTDSEQCIFDSIPNDDVIDSNLVNENLDKLCTTCVVSKGI